MGRGRWPVHAHPTSLGARCAVCRVGWAAPAQPTQPVPSTETWVVGGGRGAPPQSHMPHNGFGLCVFRENFVEPCGVVAGLSGELPGGAGPCLVGLPEYTGYRRIRSRLRPCSALAGCFTVIRVLRSSSAISVSALRSQAYVPGGLASKILAQTLRTKGYFSGVRIVSPHASRMDHLFLPLNFDW